MEEKKKLVVFKFWAPWCSPCKMLAPIFTKLAEQEENKDRFVFKEINADEEENEGLITALNVKNLPTIVLYDPNGHGPIARHTGLMKLEALQSWLDEAYENMKKTSEDENLQKE